jgi:hypothetical protein
MALLGRMNYFSLAARSSRRPPDDLTAEPGWITTKEAKALFSSKDDEYAFGEKDEVGKGNLAAFAAGAIPPCLFEFHAC